MVSRTTFLAQFPDGFVDVLVGQTSSNTNNSSRSAPPLERNGIEVARKIRTSDQLPTLAEGNTMKPVSLAVTLLFGLTAAWMLSTQGQEPVPKKTPPQRPAPFDAVQDAQLPREVKA